MTDLRAPFPWFGGKSRVADVVWQHFGDVRNYVEPFAGSLAVLLARPTPPKVETVNDKDAFLCNFWRAVQQDPDAVAHYADWVVNETDLHSRHQWLVDEGRPIVDRLLTDPEFFDARVAGWWVWGIAQWIGSGWCSQPGWRGRTHAGSHARGILTVPEQLPSLSGDSGAVGRGITTKRVSGSGTPAPALRAYMTALADRLRRVRVCCGDWERLMGPAVTTEIGVTGVFLDPPYRLEERDRVYAVDDDIAQHVREWAVANGDNAELRIALCGYEGNHEMPDTWSKFSWKTAGGYARGSTNVNNTRERIWFSPHCSIERTLFDAHA